MIRFAGAEDVQALLDIRLECLRDVNDLPEEYAFSTAVVENSRAYFASREGVNVLAFDGDKPVACASLCPLHMLPTFSHPTGNRGHLMNVYTNAAYRRQGIARRMVTMLIAKARELGMTEISLDATAEGRALYESLGFRMSDEAMTLTL